MSTECLGRIHSIQTMGTLDGPGVRFVVFFQGCNLRCDCCHNPDTWDINGGRECSSEEILKKIVRYREYFGDEGGITLSGGEPLLQTEFAKALFEGCHHENINTCLDTSGSVFNDGVKELLSHTDRVLLDIKYTEEKPYLDYVGCSYEKPLEFLRYLEQEKIPTTLRQVIITGINDNADNIVRLKEIADNHSVVDKIELLPFRRICQTKYDNMGMEFPFGHISEPKAEKIEELKAIIAEYI